MTNLQKNAVLRHTNRIQESFSAKYSTDDVNRYIEWLLQTSQNYSKGSRSQIT